MRAALTVHGHHGPLQKIAKMALFYPCMKIKKFLDQKYSEARGQRPEALFEKNHNELLFTASNEYIWPKKILIFMHG